MFDGLTTRLSSVFDGLTKKGIITEKNMDEAIREVRLALLEADVSLVVVKEFIQKLREEALGEKILKSISPTQMIIKIVQDKLTEMLGSDHSALNFHTIPPAIFLMVGLQGSGKTTTSGKLALRIREEFKKRVLLASLDIYRPAAQEQLAIVASHVQTDSLPIVPGQDVLSIAKRGLDYGKDYDVIIFDTAGRLHIDDALMQELEQLTVLVKPIETLLVADSLTGQDAVRIASSFHEKLTLTGIILTRMDGDARGGAALSMRAATGCPIKYLGIGEKLQDLEPFYPERIASRILDKGDIVSLVEKAAQMVSADDMEKLSKKMHKGEFDLNDFALQLKQVRTMGGIGGIMKLLPGAKQLQDQVEKAHINNSTFSRQEAIIASMHKKERRNPDLLNASRKKRIAAGSGTSVQDVNILLKQYDMMRNMMKKMRGMDQKSFMRNGLKNLFNP